MHSLLKKNKVIISIISLGIIFITTLVLSMNHDIYQGLPDEDKIIYGFIGDQGKALAKKYQMRQNGTGLGGMDKLWLISLSFEKLGPSLNENEARKLIVQCVDDLLKAINSNEQLRPFLKEYPFTAKNLELRIFSYDKNRVIHYFPSIAIVMDSRGEIGYLTETPSTKYDYHTEKYETYEEAVAILKKE